MLNDVVLCSQCGARGVVGSTCEYCGSTIISQNNKQEEGHSVIESWSELHLDGYSLVDENTIGECDFPEYYVARGNRTGKQGLINRNGIFVIPCIYDEVMAYLDYDVCCVRKNGESEVIDFEGNSIIASSQGIRLLSRDYATTLSGDQGLYDLKEEKQILSFDYRIIQSLEDDLFIVQKFVQGENLHGIYDARTGTFLLETECVSIQIQENRSFVAHIKTLQDSSFTSIKVLTFSIKDKSVVIEKEEIRTYKTASSSSGCMSVFLIIMLQISLYLLL